MAYLVVVVGYQYCCLFFILYILVRLFLLGIVVVHVLVVLAVVWSNVLIQIFYLVIVYLILGSSLFDSICIGIGRQCYTEGATLSQCAVYRHSAVMQFYKTCYDR